MWKVQIAESELSKNKFTIVMLESRKKKKSHNMVVKTKI